MTRRELAAAGISDPQLRSDYEHCRALAAHHGRTYFLATRLLPIDRRPAVHALYGFARTADQIVDELPAERPVADRARALEDLAGQLPLGARSTEPTVRAVADTAARYDLDPTLFRDFLTAMRTDLTVTEYETYADLEAYMHGSAAVIGLQMLPILGTVGPAEAAAPYAARLGVAFQLTNFIRDVGEDLRRGRIYLPQESLRRFGIDRARLERRQVDAPIRAWLAAEIARTRALYEQARPGLEMLAPRSQPGLRTAFTLYREILAAVERADYQVFGPRISVPLRRRIPLAAGAALLTGRRRRVRAAPRSTA